MTLSLVVQNRIVPILNLRMEPNDTLDPRQQGKQKAQVVIFYTRGSK